MGPVVGGGVLAMAGTTVALWLYVTLLGLALLLAVRIPRLFLVGSKGKSSWLSEVRAGIAAKWHIKIERGWTTVTFLVSICVIPGVGMLLPIKISSLHLSSYWFGMCEGALSGGLLVGSLGLSALLADRLGRFQIYTLAVVCMGVSFVVLGISTYPIALTGALAMTGVCAATVSLVGQTHRLLAIPASFRGRMASVQILVNQVAATIGPAVAGSCLNSFGVDGVYIIFGVAIFLGGIGYRAVPGYRAFISLSHDAVSGYYGRTYPQLFE